MDLMHAVWLALLQGLTEFLPISSSAHLILLPLFFGWEDQGLAFDVAVHVGTLIAVVSYFRKDISQLFLGWCRSVSGAGHSQESRLAWLVVLGTIPVGIAGLMLNETVETVLRSPMVIAGATIAFGLLLWIADRIGRQQRDLSKMTLRDGLIIGLFQVLALIPGTSRSGITMTGALFLGLDRTSAARFSFLLSVPVITLAGGLKLVELVQSSLVIDWLAIIVGVAVSAISAYVCIALFLKWLERMGMTPFVIYRLCLGAVLLIVY